MRKPRTALEWTAFLEERLARRRARGTRPTLHDRRLEGRLETYRQILEAEVKRAAEAAAEPIPVPEPVPVQEREPTAGEGVDLNVAALNRRSEVLRKLLRGKGNSFASRQASAELRELTKLLNAIAKTDMSCEMACCRKRQVVPRAVRISENRGDLPEGNSGNVFVRGWPDEGQKT